MFRAHDATPLDQTEGELFHEKDPALDSAGLQLEKFVSVWIQGEDEDGAATSYTNVYVRTATLDLARRQGFLQPLQGRTHQIKQLLTPGQKAYLRRWLSEHSSRAWDAADDHFRELFEDS